MRRKIIYGVLAVVSIVLLAVLITMYQRQVSVNGQMLADDFRYAGYSAVSFDKVSSDRLTNGEKKKALNSYWLAMRPLSANINRVAESGAYREYRMDGLEEFLIELNEDLGNPAKYDALIRTIKKVNVNLERIGEQSRSGYNFRGDPENIRKYISEAEKECRAYTGR